MQNRHGNVFALVFVTISKLFVMALDGFSALQFVPTAPVVLEEIKPAIFYPAFCPIILR